MPLGERAMQDIFRQLGIVLNKTMSDIHVHRRLNLYRINGGFGVRSTPI